MREFISLAWLILLLVLGLLSCPLIGIRYTLAKIIWLVDMVGMDLANLISYVSKQGRK